MSDIYAQLKQKATDILAGFHLLDEKVQVKARTLSPEEAIGNPEGDDFPIQKGRERLMQATVRGALGQAFTDRFGDYEGTLADVFSAALTNNYRRAVFTAVLNASLRSVGLIKGSVHCRDQGPKQCAEALGSYIQTRYGGAKITQVGFQPAMIAALAGRYALRVLDMDDDNIGSVKQGVTIESSATTDQAIDWADLLLVTGTTLVNGSLPLFVGKKPVLFYGTTIAGAAYLMGWDRFCDCGT